METTINVLFEHNPVPMFVYERETMAILAANAAARIQYGYSKEEFEKLTLIDLPREDLRSRFPEQTKSQPQTYRKVGLWPVLRKDCSELIADITTSDIDWNGTASRLVMSIDVTSHVRTESESRRVEASLEAAQRIAHLGSWELDLNNIGNDGSYGVWWSSEVYSIMGWDSKAGAIRREAFHQAVHPDDRQTVLKAMECMITEGITYTQQFRIIRPKGETRWIREMALMEIDPVTLSRKLYGTIQDITTEIQREIEIRHLNENLEKLVTERTVRLTEALAELESFSYSVSHDLRAPLRAIDGFSQALREDYEAILDDTGRHYLARILKAAHRMDAIIDDLLRLGRVSRTELKWHKVDITCISGNIVDELRRIEPHRKVNVTIEPNMYAHADQTLLLHVLENLIRNSWKFTAHTANPQIIVGKEETAEERVYFVRDNGAGFDMQSVGKLFKPFIRLHQAEEFEGTGIGLAIVHRIITRHKGRIWAESTPNHGATFYFTLPTATSPDENNPPA